MRFISDWHCFLSDICCVCFSLLAHERSTTLRSGAEMERYQVTCSRAIAKEMARYEGGEILSSKPIEPRGDFQRDMWAETPSFEICAHVIESRDIVMDRWASFGCIPRLIDIDESNYAGKPVEFK